VNEIVILSEAKNLVTFSQSNRKIAQVAPQNNECKFNRCSRYRAYEMPLEFLAANKGGTAKPLALDG
jgi:hypothetical protein